MMSWTGALVTIGLMAMAETIASWAGMVTTGCTPATAMTSWMVAPATISFIAITVPVYGDDATDILRGDGGHNWLFADLNDVVRGRDKHKHGHDDHHKGKDSRKHKGHDDDHGKGKKKDKDDDRKCKKSN